MATLTESGRVFFAEVLSTHPFFMAWGTGNTSWDSNFVQADGTETDLLNEIGRRKATVVEYCSPSETGNIQVPSGLYVHSDTPTNHIHLKFDFSLTDSPTKTIREIGVYAGTVIKDSVPESTEYYVPDDIASKGRIVFIERFQAVVLNNDYRRSFDFVVSL